MKRLLYVLGGLSVLAATAAVSASASSTPLRPMKGSCETTFTIGFDPVAGLPLAHILGTCRFTHLGATTYEAWQLLYPDGRFSNRAVYTAANGDEVHAVALGSGLQAGSTLAFEYREWYTGGTGRFADLVVGPTAAPSVSGSGWADLASGAGGFAGSGTIGY